MLFCLGAQCLNPESLQRTGSRQPAMLRMPAEAIAVLVSQCPEIIFAAAKVIAFSSKNLTGKPGLRSRGTCQRPQVAYGSPRTTRYPWETSWRNSANTVRRELRIRALPRACALMSTARRALCSLLSCPGDTQLSELRHCERHPDRTSWQSRNQRTLAARRPRTW